MILCAVLRALGKADRSGPLIFVSALISGPSRSVSSSSRVGRPVDIAGKLLLGIPGQMLVLWITWPMIESLGKASVQEAQQGPNPGGAGRDLLSCPPDRSRWGALDAALEALLRATEADYAYVDVDRTDERGVVTWESSPMPAATISLGPDTFGDGDYSPSPDLAEPVIRDTGPDPGIGAPDAVPRPIRGRRHPLGADVAPIMSQGDVDRHHRLHRLLAGRTVGAISDCRSDPRGRHGRRLLGTRAGPGRLGGAGEGQGPLHRPVSHELRTPLSAVVGFAGTLADGLDSFTADEVAEMVGLISSQGSEVAQLVDDLLTAETCQRRAT